MYQFNGWLEVIDDPEEPDEKLTQELAKATVELIGTFDWSGADAELKVFNGSFFLNLSGSSNHPGSYPADLRTLLEHLAQHAPGSYGLIHWRDDELRDRSARQRYFVLALRRGSIVEREEALLSPIVPTIEA
jgi:hypothetical protein